MKYIRTKDGIYKTGPLYVKSKYVLKEADTIEELCNEFVLLDYKNFNELEHYSFKEINPLLELVKNLKYRPKEYRKEVRCYAAIWTEWGLKYIAKLNDKGEFELL